ncbi:uncharacterized protein LOC141718537 [Apium graveolens]|uniref:uncharacterized protein LOC141718537 n=1 Tax=Apium graveolens TaxID=4045 RepID=UPI003D7B1937
MGEASVILGIKLTQSFNGITLSQSHYMEKSIRKKYGYSNCKLASILFNPKFGIINNSSGFHVDEINELSEQDSLETISLGLHYHRFMAIVKMYYDASWIAKKSCSNGVTRYLYTLAGVVLSWKSCRETLITRSTIEAELCALYATGEEAEWLHGFM